MPIAAGRFEYYPGSIFLCDPLLGQDQTNMMLHT